MRRPVSVWLLFIALIVLALGGLAGAWGFLSDPSGSGMGMADTLSNLPVPDYTLPGIFLLVVMSIFPLVLVYGLLVRPQWRLLDPLVVRARAHWAWAGSLALGLGLAVWLAIQAYFIGFSAPIQWFTAFLDFTILLTALVSPTRRYFRVETLEQKVGRVVREDVAIAPYDPRWPELFCQEKEHLFALLPSDLIRRVEHFGSTAVPGLAAKPIVDMLVEVTDLQETKLRIAPVLEAQGYEYFWRPTHGDDGPPFYAWFIKRDPGTGLRTHHVHMVEGDFSEHWDRLLFRDYLLVHPEVAREYEALKYRLASTETRDRAAYTRGKTAFIMKVTEQAKRYFGKA